MRLWETTGERQTRYMRYIIMTFVCLVVFVALLIYARPSTPKVDPDGFITVYQVSLIWNWFWLFPFTCFIGAGILFPSLFIPHLNNMYRKYQGLPYKKSLTTNPKYEKAVSKGEYISLMTGVIVFSIIWFSVSLPLFFTIKNGYHSVQALRNGECEIVEGTVSVLDTQPSGGHHEGDQIKVNGHLFVINYFKVIFGYCDTLSHGGILKEGTYVRLYYTKEDDDNIIRIDVKVNESDNKHSR